MRLLLAIVLLALAPTAASAQSLRAFSAAVHSAGGRVSYGGGSRYAGSGSPHRHTTTRVLAVPYVPVDRPQAALLLDASGAYLVDHVARGELAARVRFPSVMDLELRYDLYAERVGGGLDAIGIARLGACFTDYADDVLLVRSGLSGLLYHDAQAVVGGALATLEMDITPIAPLVIHLDGGFGALGNAYAYEGRLTAGVQVDRTELSIGYQFFGVTPFNGAASAILHGPLLALRVYVY